MVHSHCPTPTQTLIRNCCALHLNRQSFEKKFRTLQVQETEGKFQWKKKIEEEDKKKSEKETKKKKRRTKKKKSKKDDSRYIPLKMFFIEFYSFNFQGIRITLSYHC